MSGGVYNVTFQRIYMNKTQRGPRIKSAAARGGYVKDVIYSDVKMFEIETGISVTMFCEPFLSKFIAYFIEDGEERNDDVPLPVFDNFRFENIVGEKIENAGEFLCLDGSHCKGMFTKEVR